MENFTPCNMNSSMAANDRPSARAFIRGNREVPGLYGVVTFYETRDGGVIVCAEVFGLPTNGDAPFSFYGMHIHESGNCLPPFDRTGGHYNPANTAHPNHAGDLPPLQGNRGYAWMCFYTERFKLREILNKSLVIHSMRDDFTSQPAGDSGTKIGCGVIYPTPMPRA